MHDALDSQLGGMATWRRPEGGYFFWLRFGDDVDTARLVGRAAERGVGFLPGAVSSAAGGLASFARLSFAHYGEEEIREGVARLRTLFD